LKKRKKMSKFLIFKIFFFRVEIKRKLPKVMSALNTRVESPKRVRRTQSKRGIYRELATSKRDRIRNFMPKNATYDGPRNQCKKSIF